MTFRAKHPLIDKLIDELIDRAKREERLQVGVDLCPDLKLAAHLRKAQVKTRKARKALVDQMKLTLARENSGGTT